MLLKCSSSPFMTRPLLVILMSRLTTNTIQEWFKEHDKDGYALNSKLLGFKSSQASVGTSMNKGGTPSYKTQRIHCQCPNARCRRTPSEVAWLYPDKSQLSYWPKSEQNNVRPMCEEIVSGICNTSLFISQTSDLLLEDAILYLFHGSDLNTVYIKHSKEHLHKSTRCID